jgi:hypothetical protein
MDPNKLRVVCAPPGAEWLDAPPVSIGGFQMVYKLENLAAQLLAQPNVQHLEIVYWKTEGSDAVQRMYELLMPVCATLKNFMCSSVTDFAVETVHMSYFLRRCHQLQMLTLVIPNATVRHYDTITVCLRLLAELPKLTHLVLSGFYLPTATLPLFEAAMQRQTQIVALTFTSVPEMPRGVVMGVNQSHTQEEYDMLILTAQSRAPLSHDPEALFSLRHLTRLRSLTLSNVPVWTGENSVLARLLSLLPNLTILAIICCRLGFEGFRVIVPGLVRCKQLRKLDLGYNNIELVGMELLALTLDQLPRLTDLNVAYNGHDCLGPLAEYLRTHQHICRLDLDGNACGISTGEQLVEAIRQSPQLKEISMSHVSCSREITHDLIDALVGCRELESIRMYEAPMEVAHTQQLLALASQPRSRLHTVTHNFHSYESEFIPNRIALNARQRSNRLRFCFITLILSVLHDNPALRAVPIEVWMLIFDSYIDMLRQ